MKKIIIAAASLFAVFTIASPAQAYVYEIDGNVVSGYVSWATPVPTPEQAFVKEIEVPQEEPMYLFGNTQVYDIAMRLNAEDRFLFYRLIENAGIRY